jgi:hypothetical protein
MIDEQRYRALIQQLATGGITGNKTYHQYHDQFVPVDSEGAGYANGGGVGSMMKAKRGLVNEPGGYAGYYAGGGADYIGLNPKNAPIRVEDLTVKDNDGNFLISAADALENQDGIIGATTNIMEPGVQTIEGALINDDYPNDKIRSMVTTPDRFSNTVAPVPNKASWEGYEDLIMNPENNPNALNWQRTLNNIDNEAFNEIKGINFIDAPIEKWSNRENHPMKGLWDKNVAYKALNDGTPESTAKWLTKKGYDLPKNLKGIDTRNWLQKTTDKFSNLKDGITSVGQRFKEGAGMVFSPLSAIANMRNPLNPKSQNYNPNLVGQLNSLWNTQGSVPSGSTTFMSQADIEAGNFGTNTGPMLVQTDTGLKYGSGSVLAGENAISGWGSNDYLGQLEKKADYFANFAQKKALTTFQQKKYEATLAEIQREKDRQAAETQKSIDAERAAGAAANAATQRRAGRGGDHMSRSRDRGGLGISRSQAQSVSDANRAAGMGGWGLAQGGIISLKR